MYFEWPGFLCPEPLFEVELEVCGAALLAVDSAGAEAEAEAEALAEGDAAALLAVDGADSLGGGVATGSLGVATGDVAGRGSTTAEPEASSSEERPMSTAAKIPTKAPATPIMTSFFGVSQPRGDGISDSRSAASGGPAGMESAVRPGAGSTVPEGVSVLWRGAPGFSTGGFGAGCGDTVGVAAAPAKTGPLGSRGCCGAAGWRAALGG